MEQSKLLSDNQFGFRSGKSTEKAIIKFTKEAYHCLEMKFYVLGIFLDLSKAFDSLDHVILLEKFENMGICGIPLKLLKSNLSGRKQAVYCNNNKPMLKTIVKGVPQGSILGPLLFLVYFNDICNASSCFSYVIFADYTNLLLKDKSLEQLHIKVNNELVIISKWVSCNKLIVNTGKTKYILFQDRSITNYIGPVYFAGNEILRVPHTKFLGVIIDENVNWIKQNTICLYELIKMLWNSL